MCVWTVASGHVVILQRRKELSCLQPSSSGCRARWTQLACGQGGRSGRAWSRYPSWSTDPSHPGPRYRTGRHMPAARTLSTHNIRLFISLRTLNLGRFCFVLGNWTFYDVTFPLSKICCVQLYNTICEGKGADIIIFIMQLQCIYHTLKKMERTNSVHTVYSVHIVSLPQVEGHLSDSFQVCFTHFSLRKHKLKQEKSSRQIRVKLTPPFLLVFLKTLQKKLKI